MRAFLAVVLVAATLTGCDDGVTVGQSPDPDHEIPGWTRLADLPLSPRQGPVVVSTGKGIVAVGGDIGDPCPPNADCAQVEAARDGAILDPVTGTWTSIAPAPRTIPAYTRGVAVAGHVFLRVDRALLDYDLAHDRWRILSRVSPWYDLEADRGRLILVSGSDEQGVRPDLVYDVRTGRWSALPPDPLGKTFDRSITATSAGLVLTARALVPSPGADDEPTYLMAARWTAKEGWTRLPDATDMLGGGRWAWTGTLMVAVALDVTNGGGDPPGDYGRTIPFGGRLDPATGTWSRLPNAPEYLTGGWVVDAVGGGELIAAEGWVYDDSTHTWRKVPRPDGAPERPGPAAWSGDRVYVIGGTNDARKAADAYETSVWSWSAETKPRL